MFEHVEAYVVVCC